jgi:HSP20 family protein
MALMKHEPPKPLDAFDRFFGQWPEFLHRPVVLWPRDLDDVLRVDEYQEDGTLVVKAEMAGIDPDKDVEITLADGTLHIKAERRSEVKSAGTDFTHQELRYGSFSRDVPMPEGATEKDVVATYKDGILEVRVPIPRPLGKPEPKKIAVNRT